MQYAKHRIQSAAMGTKALPSRRTLLTAAATGLASATVLSGSNCLADSESARVPADPKVRGPFPILSTPFKQSGEVDYDVLAQEAKFVSWGGCPGMIWPQSSDSVDLLTREEKMKGMQVLADVTCDLPASLCLGVQGKDTEEMLAFAKHAEKLQPEAIISRPPDTGKSQQDLKQYWEALAAVATRPVILQTTGGAAYRGPHPAPELMFDLARRYPHFGYIKEEAGDIKARMQAELAAMPPVRRVFSARGGYNWLNKLKFGTEGVITERAAYADVLARIWQLHLSQDDPETLQDVFNKFLNMVNVDHGNLRGANLYIWKKRGVFKNLLSREYGPGRSTPATPILKELKLGKQKQAKTEAQFKALAPTSKKWHRILPTFPKGHLAQQTLQFSAPFLIAKSA